MPRLVLLFGNNAFSVIQRNGKHLSAILIKTSITYTGLSFFIEQIEKHSSSAVSEGLYGNQTSIVRCNLAKLIGDRKPQHRGA